MFTPPSFPIHCDNCASCLPTERLIYVESAHEHLCGACHDDYMADKAERAQQAADEAFYCGDGPMTAKEERGNK